MGYIYKIINSVNEKIYIGQTKNPIKYRWQHHLWKGRNPDKPDNDYPLYRAMRKYGTFNFSIEQIEEIPDNLLNEREIYWIKEYNSCVPNGYNCDLGGAGVSKFDHQEILNYFLTTGQKNASKTAQHFKCSLITVLKILEKNNLEGQGQYQPIYQIDLKTGEILQEFNSLIEARQQLNIGRTQLWNAVNGQAKTAGGYAWCKIQDYDNFILENCIDKKKVKVLCKETNQVFESASAAVKWLKENCYSKYHSHANILKVCDGLRKTAYGFHWSRV